MDIAKAGTYLCVNYGEDSNCENVGVYQVCRSFTPMRELSLWLQSHPEQKEVYGFHPSEFVSYLLAERFLVKIQYGTFFLGSYDSFEACFKAGPPSFQENLNDREARTTTTGAYLTYALPEGFFTEFSTWKNPK